MWCAPLSYSLIWDPKRFCGGNSFLPDEVVEELGIQGLYIIRFVWPASLFIGIQAIYIFFFLRGQFTQVFIMSIYFYIKNNYCTETVWTIVIVVFIYKQVHPPELSLVGRYPKH